VLVKPYPEDPLGNEVDLALREAVGNRYYYIGLAARYIYQLYDRFGNLNLIEVKVPRKLAAQAAERLNATLSDWYTVVPDKMSWELVQEAMQYGTVLRLVPSYRPREKGRQICGIAIDDENKDGIDCYRPGCPPEGVPPTGGRLWRPICAH
jgi:hypothetical protein